MRIAKIIATSLLSLTLLAGCTVGKGIITVNGEGVSKTQYNEMFKTVIKNPQYKMFTEEAKDPDSFFSLMTRDRVVNELIVKTLLNQEVAKRKIKITNEDIKLQKQKIIDSIGGEERLKDLMAQNNVSEKQFNNDIVNEVKINKLVEAIADVKVNEAEVKDFYVKNKAQFNYPDRVRASHILISANPDEIRQKIIDGDKKGELNAAQIEEKVKFELDKKLALANEVREKVAKNPDDFAKLAKQYSEDKTSAAKGGDLGFFTRDNMVKPFSDAAFSLKPNTVSNVVATQFGNHIIIVTDRAKAGIQPFDKVQSEIASYLEQTKKINALQKLFDGLKSNAKIIFNDPSYDPTYIQEKIREKAKAQMQKEKQEGLELGPIGDIKPEAPEKK